jgi:hypothetical protein
MPEYIQPPDSPRLRDDLFPAQVHALPGPFVPPPGSNSLLPPGVRLLYRPARVLLSATHAWVFTDGEDAHPHLVVFAALDDVQGNRRTGYSLTLTPSAANPTPDHDNLLITRYANCGCGSRLRSFSPFKIMKLIAQT